MGQEVGQVASKLAAAVECVTCGIGIGIDMVGKRWGQMPYDWQGKRFDHACKVTRGGLDEKQREAVIAIEADLEKWAQMQTGASYQPEMPDPRLPREYDEDDA